MARRLTKSTVQPATWIARRSGNSLHDGGKLMASIRREEIVRVSAEKAWAALRNVGMPHRLFADVLVDSRIDGDVRTVTFANGMTVRERIVDIDEENKRVAYAVIDDIFEHHSASMEIVPDGLGRCRFVWISDFLPNERLEMVAPLVEQGSRALVRNLEADEGVSSANQSDTGIR